jgi:hypothetical protein
MRSLHPDMNLAKEDWVQVDLLCRNPETAVSHRRQDAAQGRRVFQWLDRRI